MTSAAAREALYDLEAVKARKAKRGEHPICNICDLPITPGQAWDESHEKQKPRWLGGAIEGIAHRKCNRQHNNEHDTPLYHKVKRVRQKHIGIKPDRTIRAWRNFKNELVRAPKQR